MFFFTMSSLLCRSLHFACSHFHFFLDVAIDSFLFSNHLVLPIHNGTTQLGAYLTKKMTNKLPNKQQTCKVFA